MFSTRTPLLLTHIFWNSESTGSQHPLRAETIRMLFSTIVRLQTVHGHRGLSGTGRYLPDVDVATDG